jgi:hypothetical protein
MANPGGGGGGGGGPNVHYVEWRILSKGTAHAVATAVGGDFRIPTGSQVIGVGAYVDAAAVGATLTTIDINVAGVSILSTKITIDASEKSSKTAATPPVISDPDVAADAIFTPDIDAIGNTTPAEGLVVWMEVVLS